MSGPQPPIGDGNVPDKVLEELLAAFASDSAGGPPIDFDDPSIDALLGLSPAPAPVVDPPPAKPPAVDPPAVDPPAADPPAAEVAALLVGNDRDDPDVWRRTSATSPTTFSTDVVGSPDGASGRDATPGVNTRQPIKIGGDDLPDAVYLNEEAEERLRGTSGRSTEASIRTERATIVIGDDEIEGSSGGIPIQRGSASIDPRLRARRIAVRRAIGRKRLRWFAIIGVVLLVVAGGLALLGSSLFAVQRDQIVVSGAHRLDPAVLNAVIDDLAGTPVLLIDTHSFEQRLTASVWVKQARVSTAFPHSATIEIIERVPIATYAGSDGRYRIVAADGIVVDVIAGRPLEFMLITGPGPNVESGSSSGEAFTRSAELVEALSATVRTRTESVGVSDTGELSLRFRGATAKSPGGTVVLGGPTNLLDKLTRLEAFLQQNGADQCTLINVSTPEISQKC